MNAPVLLHAPDLDDLENLAPAFAECCSIQAWFVNEGWIPKQQAVDNLQQLIECLNVHGEDRNTAQAIMAEAFAPHDAMEDLDLPSVDLVRHCELADFRDRWKHTGEAPPSEYVRNSDISGKPANKPQRLGPPQSTAAAFNYVVALGDPEYLARWLRDHSDVAATLIEGIERCQC